MSLKKSSKVTFESFAVNKIPQCKKPLSGIRAGSIKRQKRVTKENPSKPNAPSLITFSQKPIQSHQKPSIHRPKPCRPLNLSYNYPGKPLQVAFYNFLPSLESFSYTISPKINEKTSYLTVKENKYLHKYFERTLKSTKVNNTNTSMTVQKVYRSNSCEGIIQNQSGTVENSTKLIVPRYDSPDYELTQITDYLTLLDPSLNV